MATVEGDYVAPAARDTYFQNEPNLIAPFDFDYAPQNVEWDTRSQHVALTIDGIRFVKERRKTCCGLSCTDQGRESKTVPYDKITDCDVQEPAGTACCCCIERVLSTVNVDTASSGPTDGGVRHELVLHGLVDAHAFKHSVWAMKRRLAGTTGAVQTSMPVSSPVQLEMQRMAPKNDLHTALLTDAW
eukprot:g27401.t1